MSWRLKDSDSLISIRWVPRYDGVERLLHWSHTIAFLPLTLTGMVLFMPVFAPLAQGPAGQFIRLTHRLFAVFFISVPILYAVFRPRRLVNTLRDLRFSRYDIEWFKAAIPYYVLGRHLDMPPQGRFNTGEKINVIVLVSGTILFSITGLVMWFGKFLVPPELFRAMVILHDLTMILSVNMFIIHFYLAVAHPMMWQSLISMRFGVVSESYAREHHATWFYGEERARKLYEEKKGSKHASGDRGEHVQPTKA
jgi:formate dehydrogenase subunit gamma